MDARPVICDLGEAAKSLIRSGVRISGVSHATLELVHNAVDSGADDISVSVNLNSFKLQVGQFTCLGWRGCKSIQYAGSVCQTLCYEHLYGCSCANVHSFCPCLYRTDFPHVRTSGKSVQ